MENIQQPLTSEQTAAPLPFVCGDSNNPGETFGGGGLGDVNDPSIGGVLRDSTPAPAAFALGTATTPLAAPVGLGLASASAPTVPGGALASSCDKNGVV